MSWEPSFPDDSDRVNLGSIYASNEGRRNRHPVLFICEILVAVGNCFYFIRKSILQQCCSHEDQKQRPERNQRPQETLQERLVIKGIGLHGVRGRQQDRGKYPQRFARGSAERMP